MDISGKISAEGKPQRGRVEKLPFITTVMVVITQHIC